MALQYALIPVTAFQQNCSLLWCDVTHEAAVVDPGGDPQRIEALVARHGVRPTQILLTHGHLDHVGAAPTLAATWNVPIIGPQREDAFWLDALPEQARMFGFPHLERFAPSRWLEDGEQIRIGEETLQVLHTPGHTPGHVVFFSQSASLAVVGDVLFAGSIGRTDFPRGDHQALLDSIRRQLWPLGDEVAFIPGHGPMSSIGDERQHNPFVADR